MIAVRKPARSWPLAVAVIAGWLTVIAHADPPVPAAHSVKQSVGALSMDQAIRMAEQRFKARVVRAEPQQDGNHTVYILRMLNESGRVWTVRIDASNGSVL
jgi:uncharacterized membrane protein YkoI